MIVLGLDTSNYTTSAASFDGSSGHNCSRLLEVRPGALGLRQSDALFQHVKRLPELIGQLEAEREAGEFCAVGVSTRPRAVEGSYMPCFLAGHSQAKTISSLLHVPLFEFSHQQGHIAAILQSTGNTALLEQEFLAWHLSGGTTELLHVYPGLRAEILGGTSDISAGQLIDRTGQLLGLDFPSGKALDALAAGASEKGYRVKVSDMRFSLSGMQNKTAQLHERGAAPETVAAFALATCVNAVEAATRQAFCQLGKELPVIFTGGVSSNSMLRKRLIPRGAVFGPPVYSTDNAFGIAVLTYEQVKKHD